MSNDSIDVATLSDDDFAAIERIVADERRRRDAVAVNALVKTIAAALVRDRSGTYTYDGPRGRYWLRKAGWQGWTWLSASREPFAAADEYHETKAGAIRDLAEHELSVQRGQR